MDGDGHDPCLLKVYLVNFLSRLRDSFPKDCILDLLQEGFDLARQETLSFLNDFKQDVEIDRELLLAVLA